MHTYQGNNTTITYSLKRYYGIEGEMIVNGKIVCRDCSAGVFRTHSEAEEFIRMIAKEGVEPCHLDDVVSDYLNK